MLTKEEELGCLELLKSHFPNLNGSGLVIGLYEFLTTSEGLHEFRVQKNQIKERIWYYIQKQLPYILLDESEGYKCLFFKGKHIKAQYDVTHNQMLRFTEL